MNSDGDLGLNDSEPVPGPSEWAEEHRLNMHVETEGFKALSTAAGTMRSGQESGLSYL